MPPTSLPHQRSSARASLTDALRPTIPRPAPPRKRPGFGSSPAWHLRGNVTLARRRPPGTPRREKRSRFTRRPPRGTSAETSGLRAAAAGHLRGNADALLKNSPRSTPDLIGSTPPVGVGSGQFAAAAIVIAQRWRRAAPGRCRKPPRVTRLRGHVDQCVRRVRVGRDRRLRSRRRSCLVGARRAVQRTSDPSIGSATGPNVTRTTSSGSRVTIGLGYGLKVTRTGADCIGVTLGPVRRSSLGPESDRTFSRYPTAHAWSAMNAGSGTRREPRAFIAVFDFLARPRGHQPKRIHALPRHDLDRSEAQPPSFWS
jgi:hypothetical protein